MSIQTEIKQEKELFDLIIDKIKKSKSIEYYMTRMQGKEKFKLDTMVVELSFCENPHDDRYRTKSDEIGDNEIRFVVDTDILNPGVTYIDKQRNIIQPGQEIIDTLIIKDNAGKKIIARDCKPYDVEGDALKLQQVIFLMAGKMRTALMKRLEKERENKRKQEELKRASQRVKESKLLREQQQKERTELAQALKTIKSL